MDLSGKRWFFGLQILVWSVLALVTRLSWFDQQSIPPWTNLILYSAFGFVISTGLGATFIRLTKHSANIQLVSASLLTISAALLWRAAYNALEYHILETANNTYEFWGYFHYGRLSVFQLTLWAAVFWLLHFYLQVKSAKGTGSEIKTNQASQTDDFIDEKHMHPKGIAIKDGGTTHWVAPETIESIVSAKDYLCIKIGTEILIHRATMKKFSETLPAFFIRCHRSHIVNVEFISTIKSEDEQTLIHTTSGAKHPVSRRYKADVKSRLSDQV